MDIGEKMEAFKDKYGISAEVTIEHCKIGKHYTRRPTSVVAIPMITFIEGRMRIPMDRVMHDFLLFFRTSHSLCSINLFKIVNNVARIIEKMNIDLTHHNINQFIFVTIARSLATICGWGTLQLDLSLVFSRTTRASTMNF